MNTTEIPLRDKVRYDLILMETALGTKKMPSQTQTLLAKKYGVTRERIRQLFAILGYSIYVFKEEKTCAMCDEIVTGTGKYCQKHLGGKRVSKYDFTKEELKKKLGKQFRINDIVTKVTGSYGVAAYVYLRWMRQKLVHRVAYGKYEVSE